MNFDSPHWCWAKGYCRKHLGNSVPCPVCIATNDPDLESQNPFVMKPSNVVPPAITKGSSLEFFGLEGQPELVSKIDFDERPLIERMKEAHENLLKRLAIKGNYTQQQIMSIGYNLALPIPQYYYAPTEIKTRIPIDIDLLRASIKSSTEIESIRESLDDLIENYGDSLRTQFLAEGGTEEEWAYLIGEE